MAMTGAVSAHNPAPARVIEFGSPPRSIPVRPGRALQWGLVVLAIANLGRIPLLAADDRSVAFVLNDVGVLCMGGLLIIAGVIRRSLVLDAVALFALAFAAIGFGSALAAVPRFGLSPTELLVSLSYLARWLAYFAVYLFVINNVRADQVGGIWQTLVKVILAFTAFGVFQSFFLPDFAQMVYPNAREYIDWDPQGHRLVSTVLDPNIAGAMIVLVLVIQLAQISVGVPVPWWQPGLLLVGLALTLSRSAILALIAGLLVIVAARGVSLRLMKLFGVILFLSLALIPRLISFAQTYARFDVGAGTSAGTRVMAWLTALQIISENPWVGVGFNTYGYVKQNMGLALTGASSYASDGGLLFALAMTGVFGLTAFLMMLWSVIRRCRKIWRDQAIPAESRGFAIGTAAGVAAICVHSLFANSIFTTFVMEIMWVSWGITFVIARAASRRLNETA